MRDGIFIKGAKEHNLKNIDVEIPRNKFTVVTGLSGSGKSSLAFDTIYAEGQRRYVESLSSYARQFLGQMEKPDVEYIQGLSPAISIEQRNVSKNPRSTLGTITEIYDYLRVLFARIGKPYCYKCGKEISQQTVSNIADRILELPPNTRFTILSPVVRQRKGEYKQVLENISKQGFVRVRVDGTVYGFDEEIKLDKKIKHTIEVVVDRMTAGEGIKTRLVDSLETAVKLSEGIAKVEIAGSGEILFSEKFACPDCGVSYEEISPRIFSFNNPYGACQACSGLGTRMIVDAGLVVPDKNKPLSKGAVHPWSYRHSRYETPGVYYRVLRALSSRFGFSMDVPFGTLPEETKNLILYGVKDDSFNARRYSRRKYLKEEFEGVINNLERRYRETYSEHVKEWISRYMSPMLCDSCSGKRLRNESLSVKIDGKSIMDVSGYSVGEAYRFFSNFSGTPREMKIAHQLLKEITERLRFLMNVGLDYLTLDRSATTLSGGESQRIHLATQIGSGLVGVLYILDEPSIGLHQRDNARLLGTLQALRDIGNTLIVVEHDRETIMTADYVIDLGPGAGEHGGYVVAKGTPLEIIDSGKSLTGRYLKGELKIEWTGSRRKGNGLFIEIKGAKENNLKNIDVKIPLGVITCITGVSGSGKSTLIYEILFKAVSRHFYNSKEMPGKHGGIDGLEHVDKVINIDQSPIGRTPRSNPATYTGMFTDIRNIFAKTQEAKARGYGPGRFSFNVKGGRCGICEGDGLVQVEMHFLPDVYITCEECKGKRYNRETLEVKYKGKSISDVLEMTVEEALSFFENIPSVRRIIQTLFDVGLGYIRLGQSATTLSGGEAQRVKLASELCKRSTGRTLYILDEPTTGLHFADIDKLLAVLHRFADAGNTVVVIEHNLDVIKVADNIIDLGPEGGDRGGYVIAEGTPEKVAVNAKSYTGQFLQKAL